jgi:thymidylate kinase
LIELLRHLCTARDRYLLYLKARRFALQGGIAVCERYPISENRALVGPSIPALLSPNSGPLHRWFSAVEASYYRKIVRPDLILVLRLHPELAVRRKPEEPADYVRSRGQIIWDTDWSSGHAVVVDAAQPLNQVLSELKAIIWPHV